MVHATAEDWAHLMCATLDWCDAAASFLGKKKRKKKSGNCQDPAAVGTVTLERIKWKMNNRLSFIISVALELLI